MKNTSIICLLGATFILLSSLTNDGFGQATESNNTVGSPAYLGWNSTTNIPLRINHKGNRSIIFETNLQRRMALYSSGQIFIPGHGTTTSQNVLLGVGTTGNQRNTAMEIFSGFQPSLNNKTGMLIDVRESKGIQYGLRAYSVGGSLGNNFNVGIAAYVGGQSISGISVAILGNALNNCPEYLALAGHFDGDVFVTNLTGPSDANLKENVEDISDLDIDKLFHLTPQSYFFKQNIEAVNLPKERQYGLVAQEVDSLFPNIVSEIAHPADINDENEILNEEVTYLGISYLQFLPLLTSGWQHQEMVLSEQRERMAIVDAELTALENQLYTEINTRKINVSNQLDAFVVYPNPVENIFIVEVELTKPSKSSIKLYNANMQLVETYLTKRLNSGKHQLQFDISSHPRGMYFVVFSADGEIFTLKLKH